MLQAQRLNARAHALGHVDEQDCLSPRFFGGIDFTPETKAHRWHLIARSPHFAAQSKPNHYDIYREEQYEGTVTLLSSPELVELRRLLFGPLFNSTSFSWPTAPCCHRQREVIFSNVDERGGYAQAGSSPSGSPKVAHARDRDPPHGSRSPQRPVKSA